MPATRPAFSYRFLSFLLFILWVLHAGWQAIKHRQLNYFWQRLGIYSTKNHQQNLWIHASSVGEIELIKPLVLSLHEKQSILVTTFTVTGFQHAIKILPDNVLVRVLPIDLLPLSQHFINSYNFKLALIAETELWPETLFQTAKNGIKLIQINARLSDKSLKTSRWIKQQLKNTLAYFDHFLTRTEQDVNNLKAMGANANKITVAGNLKYAHLASATQHNKLLSEPYLLFASTHEPEEKLFASLIKKTDLKQLIVIAPRHPQRAKEILKSLLPLNLVIKQRSLGQLVTEDTQIYLADTLGELKDLMAFADLVIMGGSFNQVGGHNVLEPARLGKAVITGPSDQNIQQDIALLLQHEAIIQVDDLKQLSEKISFLLENPDTLNKLSDNATRVMQSQTHILQNYLTVIENYL